MNRQAVLDVLNGLEVIDQQGGEDAYMLVENSEENRAKLSEVGVSAETILKYGDTETFCILALAFGEGYCDEVQGLKLVALNIHELKTWPKYFHAGKTGEKPFEVRKNDRDYQVGDLLKLQEWSHPVGYTGDEVTVQVTYILNDPAFVKDDHVVMGITKYAE
jgi:hypothetical protein